MNTPKLRICYFGTYRAEYSRNNILLTGLRMAGAEVIECHEPLWHGIEDRVQAASGGWLRPSFWSRILGVYLRLMRRYRHVGDYDVMVVGYPGQFDVFLARLLSRLRRKPLVWDVFMSIYLIALERGLDKRSPRTVDLLRRAERLALRLPDLLIQDTPEYVTWLAETHDVSPGRFRLVPTGADDRIFRPTKAFKSQGDDLRVIYYGTFIPNHGVEYIVNAARLLADDPHIQFDFVGRGPDREKAQALAEQYRLTNVTFTDWLEQATLVERVGAADICLGAFGITPQSLMTIQNKIYEGLAMAKPVISGDSPAVRRALRHGEHLYLCERGTSRAIAAAIRTLREDPDLRQRLAKNGYCLFIENYNLEKTGRRFAAHLSSMSG